MGLLSSIAGSIMGGGIDDIFNKASADRSYEMNRRLQKHDQEFQKEMRATAYQTAVDDMKKAGINPAVAMSNGGGTVMGGGSSASASAPSGSAENLATAEMGLKQAESQIENQTALTNADVELKRAQSTKALKEAGFTDKQIEYYMKHGVFPGATTTISGGALGISGSVTKPVGLKNDNNNNNNNKGNDKPKNNKSKYKYKSWTPEGVRERLGFSY